MLVKILIIIACIILLLLIVALFVKKEYSVQEEITINKPNAAVFDYVKLLKHQESYNKWAMMDPNVIRTYSGIDGIVGAATSWESENKNVGKGEQKITKIDEGKSIESVVRFEKPFKNTADVFMTTEAVSPNVTKVKWGMNGNNDYPMNLMNLFIPKMLGKDMHTSLVTLKSVLEK